MWGYRCTQQSFFFCAQMCGVLLLHTVSRFTFNLDRMNSYLGGNKGKGRERRELTTELVAIHEEVAHVVKEQR